MTREQVKEAIEKYHQDNFWSLHPSGKVQEWIYDAVLENIVKPMQAQPTKKAPDDQTTVTRVTL